MSKSSPVATIWSNPPASGDLGTAKPARIGAGSTRPLLLGTALLGTLCAGYGRRAYAQCAPSGAAGNYACSGTAATTQSLTPSPATAALVVTTLPGFSIVTAVGGAFNLTTASSGSGLSFTDNNASSITGQGYGISATNNGAGTLSITTSGAVTGEGGSVPGPGYGINATNNGAGALSITATGLVTGDGGSAIYARNYGTSLTISAGAVSGGAFGVSAMNQGSGALSITTTGLVSGSTHGIRATNYGTSLTISAQAVSGAVSGIAAYNHGSGSLSITASGAVSGGLFYGLLGKGYGSGQDVRIQAASVSGGTDGVVGMNYGGGALSITTTGTVTGAGGSGVVALSRYGTGVSVQTGGSVTGSQNGVDAKFGAYGQSSPPTGALSITAAGAVTGTGGAGIFAGNFGHGASTTAITVTSTGVVAGQSAGVYAYSALGGADRAHQQRRDPESVGASTDLAVAISGAPATIVNNGTITGVVALSYPAGNAMTNNGTWNTAGGTNAFGGSDTLTNAAPGAIVAAVGSASSPVTTTFNGLATFTNAGLVTMQNGVVGDQLVINGNFVGQSGRIALDTTLGGDNSPTDKVIINGNASGTTGLVVYNTGGLGALTTNGIEIVAISGSSSPTAFFLSQPVEAGAYAYTLVEASGGAGESWSLRSTLIPVPPPAAPPPATPPPAASPPADPPPAASSPATTSSSAATTKTPSAATNTSPPTTTSLAKLAPAPTGELPNYRNEVPVYLALPELANQLAFAMADTFDARFSAGREDFAPPPPPGFRAEAPACEGSFRGRCAKRHSLSQGMSDAVGPNRNLSARAGRGRRSGAKIRDVGACLSA